MISPSSSSASGADTTVRTRRDGALGRRVERERFEPSVALGWIVNPFFFARRGLRKELGELLPRLTGVVLDVGCGRKPYRHLATGATRYVGVEVDTPATREHGEVDVFYDGRMLPVADGSYDGVVCSQVLEHVFAPREFVAELARTLRPGGLLVLATPFAWDEHEQPYDFARYSSFGLRAVLEAAGFEIVEQRKTCADGRALAQLATAYLFKVTRTESRSRVGRWRNAAAQLGLIAPVTLVGSVLAAAAPRNPDFYLDNVVLARKRLGAGGGGVVGTSGK